MPSATALAPAAISSSRVESRGHSAHADERQVDGRRAGVDGRQGDRLQGRTGVAAGAAAELRAKRLLVESEPAQRVHERQTVGSRGLHRTRNLGDVPGCRRELRVQRQARRGATCGHDLGCALGRLVDVRAGEVQLDRLDVLERSARLGVLARRESSDRDPERNAELPQPRQRLLRGSARGPGSRARSSSACRSRSPRSGRVGFPRAARA